MSERVDKFCDGLRNRLNAIEGRIQSVKTDVQGLPAKAGKAVQQKLDEARTRFQAQKEGVDKARANLKVWADQKMGETREAINDWKAKGEVRKLNARAERSEAYAEAALIVTLASIDEAEAAVLDAVAARKDAEAAQ